MYEKQITVGFKISASQKRAIDETAQKYGKNTSEYLRALLLEPHSRLKALTHLPQDLIIDAQHVQQISSLLFELQEIYPDYSNSQLIELALQAATKNEEKVFAEKLGRGPKAKEENVFGFLALFLLVLIGGGIAFAWYRRRAKEQVQAMNNLLYHKNMETFNLQVEVSRLNGLLNPPNGGIPLR